MSDQGFTPGDQFPEEYRADMNPHPLAGQNNMAADQQEKNAPTAYDVKDVHRQFSGFTDDELKQIPVLPAGMRLEQGATYVDLQDEQLQEFTARGDMSAEAGHYYVPKSEVSYPLWNRLIGITNPERLDEADEG
ncbi:MAG TPA: hypothetical protein VFT66_09465 [Roseiflexaceae bacterium]|jgi:hypothetical protein|nr:hypothetical protein [Roseiflexaceae bacterium]